MATAWEEIATIDRELARDQDAAAQVFGSMDRYRQHRQALCQRRFELAGHAATRPTPAKSQAAAAEAEKNERWRIATHESCHVIAAIEFGADLEHVSVYVDGLDGVAVTDDAKMTTAQKLIFFAAGPVGELLLIGGETDAAWGSPRDPRSDAFQFEALLATCGKPEDMRALQLVAADNLIRANEEAIGSLSIALYQRLTLTGAEVFAVLRPSGCRRS